MPATCMPPPVVGVEGRRLLVFVASAADRWEENVSSFREMTQNLLANQLDPASLPLVLQYNKRDLPEVTPIPFMDRTLNARKVQAISAVAIRGEGVLETFADILTATMQDLVTRYQILEVGKGQSLPQWVKQTMLGTHLAAPEPAPPPPPPSRRRRLTPPEPPPPSPAPGPRKPKKSRHRQAYGADLVARGRGAFGSAQRTRQRKPWSTPRLSALRHLAEMREERISPAALDTCRRCPGRGLIQGSRWTRFSGGW